MIGKLDDPVPQTLISSRLLYISGVVWKTPRMQASQTVCSSYHRWCQSIYLYFPFKLGDWCGVNVGSHASFKWIVSDRETVWQFHNVHTHTYIYTVSTCKHQNDAKQF